MNKLILIYGCFLKAFIREPTQFKKGDMFNEFW